MIIERPKRRRPRVELVPLIDVTFIILVYFVIFSTFRTADTAMKLNLPRAASGDEQAQVPVVVTVDREGGYYLDGAHLSVGQMQTALARRIAADPQQVVLIKADRETRYQYLVDAMDAVRGNGGSHLALAVEPDRTNAGAGAGR